MEEGQQFWTCSLTIPDIHAYLLLAMDRPFSITFNGEVFQFIVESLHRERRFGQQALMVTGISPTAALAAPRAAPVSGQLLDNTNIYTFVSGLVGQAVSWEMVSPMIPGGTVNVSLATPLALAKGVVETFGGVLETRKNGSLHARKKWPVSPPDWDTATPAHILSDNNHILAMTETLQESTFGNAVNVADAPPSEEDQFFKAEMRQQKQVIYDSLSRLWKAKPLDLFDVYVFCGQNVKVTDFIVSIGRAWEQPGRSIYIVEDVVFTDSYEATTQYPVAGISKMQWIGPNLGNPKVNTNGTRLVVPTRGTSVLQIGYTSNARVWGVARQVALSDSERTGLPDGTFPPPSDFVAPALEEATAIVTIVADISLDTPDGQSEIRCIRGSGRYELPDIVEPMLREHEAKLARGTTAIDDAGLYQEIIVTCLPVAGLELGQLIEFDDALQMPWRAKVVGLSYMQEGPTQTMTIKLKKKAPNVYA
ncbi:MAG: hypothetical protein HQL66_03305 [Magnetococcales bacterium]|nr:hypothetical protein [Magnetococcales bacterium]